MSYSQTADVIFLGHGVLFSEIEKNVYDLNALGHIKTSYWIDVANSQAGSSVRIVDSEKKTTRIATIDEAMREMDGLVVIAYLESLAGDGEDEFQAAQGWVSYTEAALPGRCAQIRVLLPKIPLAEKAPPGRVGWTTVALAPEDSDSPRSSIEPITEDKGPFEAAEVFAPALLGAFGLWKNSTLIPVLQENGRPISTGSEENFCLVRSYYRALDATEVENRLLKDVIDIKDRVPRTNFSSGVQTDYNKDMASVNRQYVEKFFYRHKDNLITEELPFKNQEEIRQNGWAAVKLFLKEFFKAIGSPRAWTAEVRGSVNYRVADSIKKALYGDKSIVEVVVGERTRNVSIDDVRKSSAEVASYSRPQGFQVGEDNYLSQLWSDYAEAALTLVDGSSRLPGEMAGPIDANQNPLVASRTSKVVPDVSDSFDANVPTLRKVLGEDESNLTILPFDVFRVEAFEKDLDYAVNQGTSGQTAALRQGFRDWKDQMSQSFAWQMGRMITGQLRQAQGRARSNLEQLRRQEEQAAQMVERDLRAENKKLQKKLYGVFGLEFLLLVLTGYCTARYYKPELRFVLPEWPGIDWRWCVLLCVLIVAGGTALQMKFFARARRGIRDEIEARKLANANMDIASKNYACAVEDVKKLSSAYSQFLSWSILLGRAIAYPYGRVAHDAEHIDIPTAGMPRAVKIGRVSLPDDAFKSLSAEMRNHMFKESWAGRAWDKFMERASQELQKRDSRKVGRVNDLFGLEGNGSGSTLDQISQLVMETPVEAIEHTGDKWERALSAASSLVSTKDDSVKVEYYENGQEKVASRTEFLKDFENLDEKLFQFGPAAVDSAAQTKGATSVDENLSAKDDDRDQARLTNSVSWVQFGRITSLTYLAKNQELNSILEDGDVVFEADSEDEPDVLSHQVSDTAEFDGLGPI